MTRTVLMVSAAAVTAAPLLAGAADADAFQQVQLDAPRSEAPPGTATDTEGRGDRGRVNCRKVTVSGRRDGISVHRVEWRCDRLRLVPAE